MLAFEPGIVILASEGSEAADVDLLPSVGLDVSTYEFPKLGMQRRKELFTLATHAPLEDIDFRRLASQWDQLSGGQIKLIAVGAAMLAAGDGRPIGMSHVRRAFANEQEKMLRVVRDETAN